jgi:carboxylesterase type B
VSTPLSTKQFVEKPNRLIPTRKVRVDKVDATQMKLDHAKVMDIARKDPAELPPILVYRHNGRYKVGDGHHREGAAIERRDLYIKAKVVR